MPVNGSGVATLATSILAEGTHQLRATYSGAVGFLTSNGTVVQRVDNQTVVTGSTFCNTGVVTIPTAGTSSPYPSNITVSGLTGTVTKVTATFKGLTHGIPQDLDVLLSGPQPTTNVVLLSDAGGSVPASNLDLTFDDAASGSAPTPLGSGTFWPTDDDTAGADTFPAPAPALNGATASSTTTAARRHRATGSRGRPARRSSPVPAVPRRSPAQQCGRESTSSGSRAGLTAISPLAGPAWARRCTTEPS